MVSNADIILAALKNDYERKPLNEGSAEVDSKITQSINETRSSLYEEQNKINHDRSKFLTESKIFFVSEAINRIFDEAAKKLMLENPAAYRHKLVKDFVIEEGADNLLHSFRTKSELLSEMALILTKYCKIVSEEAKKDDSPLKLDSGLTDDFYKEIEGLDMDDVTTAIKNRVNTAIDDFTTTSMDEKMHIKEILNNAKKIVKKYKNEDESVKESYAEVARWQIADIENGIHSKTNIYGSMVNKFAKNVVSSTNESYQAAYMNGAKLNMHSIAETCKTIYTFLETLNTARIKNIDEDYLRDNVL